MLRSRLRMGLLALLVACAALVLAACGSSSSSGGSTGSSGASTSGSSTGSGSSTATGTTTSANGSGGSAALPGKGKPAFVLGDKNFTEEYVLGALYQEALEAKGYTVTLKGNIGSSELIYKALTSGQIQGYPEYTGTLLTAVANISTPPKTAAAAYAEAKAYLQKHGYTMLDDTPFYDSDAVGTTKKYAAAHHLTTIADLKPLGKSVTIGGLPEFQTRTQGLVGLKRVYGITPTFKPIASGLVYNALDSGQVDAADVFTTDPQLKSGKYVVLTDPRHEFGFQNVALIVKQSVLKAEGPAFARTVNAVSRLLTTKAVISMNAAVALDKQSPAAVAHTFLKANGLA
jgi:osmoprotectant transport system substrate-binding protein